MAKHPNDMNADELRQLVGDMGEMALDLAQHLHFTNNLLAVVYRKAAYERACKMAYELAYYPYDEDREEKRGNCTVVVLGQDGLTVERMDVNGLLSDKE